MKKALSTLITTCLWGLAIVHVLIERCLIPALQWLLLLLQEQANAAAPEAPADASDDDDDAATTVQPKPTGQQLKAEVLRLHAEGMQSACDIAKATGAARTSVRRWIKARQEEAATSALAGALMPIKREATATR